MPRRKPPFRWVLLVGAYRIVVDADQPQNGDFTRAAELTP